MKAIEDDLTLSRRSPTERRDNDERRTIAEATDDSRRTEVRRKVPRRRQIDPTTCERDYSDPEIEFMQAMDDYKRANGRMFPTCSEILEVLQKLGYEKVRSTNEVAEDVAQVPADSSPPANLEDADQQDLEFAQLPSKAEF